MIDSGDAVFDLQEVIWERAKMKVCGLTCILNEPEGCKLDLHLVEVILTEVEFDLHKDHPCHGAA